MNHLLAALHIGKRRVAKAQGAHQYSRVIQWRGLSIGIENDAGSVRRGTDPGGHTWETRMSTPYGEIAGTLAVDDDPLDCFVQEQGLLGFTDAYVIGIVGKGGKFDEEKVMLGYHSAAEALDDFARHYDDPSNYFGYIASLPADVFVRRCRDGAARGKSLIPDAEARARLGQRRIARARAERDDHVDWMQAMVAKAQGVRQVAKGLSFDEVASRLRDLETRRADALNGPIDWDDVDPLPELDYQIGLLKYALRARQRESNEYPTQVSKAVAVPGPDDDLYIRIWPGRNAFDLTGELITVDLVYKSWAYYVECGNIDLEHISKTGGKTWRKKAALIEAAGFNPEWGSQMRVQYEVGRPVPGSLRVEEMDDDGYVLEFSFVAKIHGGQNEAARWLRTTLPDVPWKPSIGGQMSEPVKVVTEVNDPRLGIKGRRQEVKVARDFRWNNTAMTLEAVNHWVRPVQILTPEEVAELLGDVPQVVEKVVA